MAEAISLAGVQVRLGRREVLREVSLSARHGSVLAIVGPNGAGKSTLLKAIAGLLPSAGSILLDGVPLASLSPRVRARTVAYVPQRSLLSASLHVRDVVAQGRFA